MTSKIGLSSKEAVKFQDEFGKNEIKRTRKINPLKIFLTQFTSPLIIILIFAALVSVFIGYLPGQEPDFVDAILIIVIVFISGISGFVQEYKAEKSIENLKEFSVPSAKVFRDGEVVEMDVTETTVGDAILLEAGDLVPADGILIEAFNLKINESVLTGESEYIEKKVDEDVSMGTAVSSGNGIMVVQKIGMSTKIGQIADKLQKIEEDKTTFEIEIANFSKKVFIITGFIVVVIFLGGVFKYDLYTSLLTAISLAVAAIPEGLPAVVVLSLAIGAKAMFRNKALIRKLNVVESIGAVDIICSDKTGTITKNEMTVTRIFTDGKVFDMTDVDNEIKSNNEILETLKCGLICNDVIVKGHPKGERIYIGEQTEIGLVKIAERLDLSRQKIKEEHIRLNEESFTSDRKMMSVVTHFKESENADFTVYTKGAPEIVLERCTHILLNGKVSKMSETQKESIISQNNNFAIDALRVLGFAFKYTDNTNSKIEEDLIWIGLQAMTDPPHPEVIQVLEDCKTAGIRVVVITGDNPTTAKAIASSIGLVSKGVIGGRELDKMNEKQLRKILESGVNIFARTTPEHKMQILKILKKNYRVAMTGDGVNDSLALKQANVGISMGLKGTSVAKESSDIILLDDNFSTIVKAIKEGRRIFDNIRKFINYLLVSNIAEVMVLFLSSLFMNLDKPILLPVQILWINLLTDGMPALALGADPARPDIMKERPRDKEEPLINKKLAWLIGLVGLKKTAVLLLTFIIILPLGEDVARTTLFTGFILYEFVRIANIRYQEKLTWFSNPWLLIALISSLLLQLFIIYSPFNTFFSTVYLHSFEWTVLITGVIIGFLSAILITIAVNKVFDKKEIYLHS